MYLILAPFVIGTATQQAVAQEVTVCNSGCDYSSIGAALGDAASAGQDVVVDPGTYTEGDLTVTDRTLRSSSPDTPELTIIDATGLNVAVISDASNAIIRGLTITGGSTTENGGGIRATGGTLTLEQVNVVLNSASRGGGVGTINTILPVNSRIDIVVTDSEISNNTALTTGGGLYSRVISNNGDLTISDSVIGGNRLLGDAASGSDEAIGGGVATGDTTTVSIKNTVIAQNSAESGQRNLGGGLSTEGFTLLSDVFFVDNVSAAASTSEGSAIRIASGATIFLSGTIMGGSSGDGSAVSCRAISGPTFDVFAGTISGSIIGCTGPGRLAAGDTPADAKQSGSVKDPVNTFTGDLFEQLPPDIDLGGPMAVQFSRYYSSALLSANVISLLGDNWRHNFDWVLRRIGDSVEIVDDQGRLIEFSDDGSNWVLVGKTDIAYQLTENAGLMTLLDPRDQHRRQFEASGRLAEISDGAGNIHLLTYDNSARLSGVSDGLGRNLSFTYDIDGFLATVSDGVRTVMYGYTGNDLTGVTDSMGNLTSYAYDAGSLMLSRTRPENTTPFTQTWNGNNQVTTQSDADNNTFSLAYNGLDTTLTDPLGNFVVHTHTPGGELTAIQDQAGQTIVFGSDASGRRNTITDRLGDPTSYTFHEPSGQLASILHADGTSTMYSYTTRLDAGLTLYDLGGIVHADGSAQNFVYDINGNLTSITDQIGGSRIATYNGNGQPLSVTNRAGGVTVHSYNSNATRATTTDPAGNTTTYGYDVLDRLNQVTFADASTATISYDENNRPLSTTNARGNSTIFAYDGNGNLAERTDALNNTTVFNYDGNDRVTSVTDPLGGTSNFGYDSLARLTTLTDANMNAVTLGYDALDRQTSVTDARGNVTSFSYDAEAIINTATDPLGNSTTFDSDQMGRITRIVTPLGNSFDFAYDAMGRPAMATDPLGNISTVSRDARGLITGAALPGGISTSYVRNALGQVTTVTDPNGNNWTIAFDDQGRETGSNDPLGNATTIAYDTRSQPATVNYPGSLGTVAHTYDPTGNTTQTTFPDGTTLDYSYDSNNRLTAANGLVRTYDANGRISASNGIVVARDAGGRITSMTFATGKSVTYAYDANNNMTQVSDWLGASTGFVYDAANRLVSISRPNGADTSYTYDDDGRVIGINEGTLSSVVLTRDGNGQITDAVRTSPLSATIAAGANTLTGFDAASQITGFGYDELGRRTSDDTRTFVWDSGSRLMAYTQGGETIDFDYDAMGRLLSRAESGTTRSFVWNDALDLPSVSIERQNGNDLRYYVHRPGGQLLYSIEATDDRRTDYHFDEMGNTLFLTDDAAAVTASYAYSPYGELLSSAGSIDNGFTWQGQFGVMHAGESLYYMRARYYDGAFGRFISRDPARLIGPREANPYQYALANPLKFVDPTGNRSLNVDGSRVPSFNPIETFASVFLEDDVPSSREAMRGPKPPSLKTQVFIDALFDIEGEIDDLPSSSESDFIILLESEPQFLPLRVAPPTHSGIVPFVPAPRNRFDGGFSIRDTTSIRPDFQLERFDDDLLEIFQIPKPPQPTPQLQRITDDSEDGEDDGPIILELQGIVIIS